MGIPLQSIDTVMHLAVCFTCVFLWSTGGFPGVAGQAGYSDDMVPEEYDDQPQGYGRTCEDVLEAVAQEISSYQGAGSQGIGHGYGHPRQGHQALDCRCSGQVDADGSGECQTRRNSGGNDGRGGYWCYVENTRFMRQQCGDFTKHKDGWISFLPCF